jgi:hypothetical protein
LALVSAQGTAQGKGAVQAALSALTLVSTGRPQVAMALLEKLPALIEAEIGAARRAGDAEGYRRGLRDVVATIPARSYGGGIRQPGWLLEAITDPAKFAAIQVATELTPGQLRAVGEGRASLGPGMLAKARAALGVRP